MHTVTKFTYPTFIGTCSALAALADISQNHLIAWGAMVFLILLGTFCLIAPSSVYEHPWIRTLGVDRSIADHTRAFGLSCFLLAGVSGVFAMMSEKAQHEGGLLAQTFETVREVQTTLGLVQEDVRKVAVAVDDLKKETEGLAEVTRRWVSFSAHVSWASRQTTTGELHYLNRGAYFEMNNRTASSFVDMRVTVGEPDRTIDDRVIPVMVQDGYEHFPLSVDTAPQELTVCVSGKRREKDEWIIETFKYQLDYPDITVDPEYRLMHAEGPQVFTTPTHCGASA